VGGERCRVGLEVPDVSGDRAFPFDQFERPLGVVDDGLDLAPVADDASVLEQAFDIVFGEFGNAGEIESVESVAEVLSLGQDGAPAQTRLETLQAYLFEQASIVRDGEAPFGVVVGKKLRRRFAPAAARTAVGSFDGSAHESSLRLEFG